MLKIIQGSQENRGMSEHRKLHKQHSCVKDYPCLPCSRKEQLAIERKNISFGASEGKDETRYLKTLSLELWQSSSHILLERALLHFSFHHLLPPALSCPRFVP